MNLKQILSDLHSQRSRIDRAIAALEGLSPRRERPPKAMSLSARKRIGEAKRKWWAQQKATRKGPHFSAATRRRLSEMMKKRWAQRKRA